jgi:hypothetical protein
MKGIRKELFENFKEEESEINDKDSLKDIYLKSMKTKAAELSKYTQNDEKTDDGISE